MSAVLQHVVKYRPHWRVTYQAEKGKQVVGRGIVHEVISYGEPYPVSNYAAEVQILLFDTWCNWRDRPETRVSSCLHERFGLPWVAECGRYQVNVSEGAVEAVRALLWGGEPVCATKDHRLKSRCDRDRFVAVHYQGDSSPTKKNLTHAQACAVCVAIEQLEYVPIILDWRNQSPLTFRRLTIPTDWGRDAEMVCAVISQCAAFVGIDSGPAKCASATDTPSLVVWTGHHPAPFHDPASNTTHLVPQGYHGLEPVYNDTGVIQWFEKNYNVRQYVGDPVRGTKAWLTEVLR